MVTKKNEICYDIIMSSEINKHDVLLQINTIFYNNKVPKQTTLENVTTYFCRNTKCLSTTMPNILCKMKSFIKPVLRSVARNKNII